MASGDMAYGERLRDRAVIILGGAAEEQVAFLQGLVTNDVSGLGAGAARYAALLTPQGKYLADFLIFQTDAGDLALDCAATQAEALLKRLTMYKLRRPVTLSRAEGLVVGAVWGGVAPEGAFADPRDAALGWRIYGTPEAVDAALSGVAPGDYDLHRLRLGVPTPGVDLIENDTYILEAGFERLNGVDFRKGCFVGQEIVARMKHKATLRKGLRRVALDGAAPPGTPVEAAGRNAGVLLSNRDGAGLALLRLDRIPENGEMSAGEARLRVADP